MRAARINLETKTGVPAYALFCFDVPTSRLAGMRIQLGRGSLIYCDTQGDDLADVDLGISKTDAKAWATTDDAYAPASTSEEPIELETVSSPRRARDSRGPQLVEGEPAVAGRPAVLCGRLRLPDRPTTSRTSGTSRACITRWRLGSRVAGCRSARSSRDSVGDTSRSYRIRLDGIEKTATWPYYDDGPREPPDGIDAVVAHLDWQADPDQQLFGCRMALEDDQGRRYELDSGDFLDLCTPADHPGPLTPINADDDRDEVEAGDGTAPHLVDSASLPGPRRTPHHTAAGVLGPSTGLRDALRLLTSQSTAAASMGALRARDSA